jgi:dCTP deaminase
MAVLADIDIKKALQKGRVKIDPEPDLTSQLGSCSLDLRLSNVFRTYNHAQVPYIDPADKNVLNELTKEIKIDKGKAFIIQPQEFVLASTVESLTLADDLLARLEGRSSIGRLGIVVHSTASVFDPGWQGKVVLELGNLGKMAVALYPGTRICSLTFEEMSSKVATPYYKKKNAKYVHQKGPVASRLFKEFENKN